MTKSKLGGNKKGLGFYELMTAPEQIYNKALAAVERNDVEEFCELLGIDKTRRRGQRNE
jgi:hypothetical protein